MAISIFDENAAIDSTEFTPFNEAKQKVPFIAVSGVISSTMDLSAINPYRQGVEINSEFVRFLGTSPKPWSGNINGYTSVITIGQALSFTEYENNKEYNDLQINFDPVAYIELGSLYPYPLIFNDGPQQNKEAIIRPLSLAFVNGRDTNEAQDLAHDVRGSLEDGNQDATKLAGSTNKILQFIPFYNSGSVHTPFLDEGETYFGKTTSGSIIIDGYINGNIDNLIPFNDRSTHKIIDLFTSASTDMILVLNTKSSSLDLDEDIRENYYQKSATAGFDVYGPGQGRTGTDAICYIGTFRGC